MTTKEQAIASFIASVKSDRHYWEEWPEDSRKAFLELQNAAHTEPDCRTCANVVACMEVIGEITYCTNGDMYHSEPAEPALVLWRTK